MNSNDPVSFSGDKFSQAMRDCGRVWVGAISESLQPLGLTALQWAVLERVQESPGLSQTSLANILGIDSPSMVRLLDGLEREGWVQRRPSAEDRRVKQVWPQANAAQQFARGSAAMQRVQNKAFSTMGEVNKARFLELIEELTAALQAP